jgi:hypothetical protein
MDLLRASPTTVGTAPQQYSRAPTCFLQKARADTPAMLVSVQRALCLVRSRARSSAAPGATMRPHRAPRQGDMKRAPVSRRRCRRKHPSRRACRSPTSTCSSALSLTCCSASCNHLQSLSTKNPSAAEAA